jgi:RNA polymerase sigma-70 factor (ECF subfamily)
VIPETLPEHLHTCEQQQTGMDGELSRLLESLPRSQKEVILMLKISGMGLKEVAQAASSTVGAVKQKAHRGYKRLRCALEGRSADLPSRR